MTAKKQDFEMNQGETKKISADDTTDEDTGQTFDFGAYNELTWTLYDYRGGPVLVEKKDSTSNDVTVIDGSTGQYEVVVVGTDTESLDIHGASETFFHRVRLTDGNDDDHDLMEGTVTIYA